MQSRTEMDGRFDKEKLRAFNENVFDTMPDEPYYGPVPVPGVRAKRTSAVDWCFRAAAVILAGVLIWTFVVHERDAASPPALHAAAADVYTVPEGVRSRVTLPDSSVIWLNSGSTLLVADGFGSGNREVLLKGEGYFEVKSDPSDPFFVRTESGTSIRVTGTCFNLSCYSPEKGVKVTLLKGSVDILTGKNDVIRLKEGEGMTVRGGFSSEDPAPDIEGDTAWTRGTLHFDNTPMREVLEAVERWYGVDITVRDNSIYRNSFTADFRSESINQVMELLAITCDIVYVVDGRNITIG